MEQFNILQNEKCVSVKTEKLNDLKNRISFALKDATLQQGFEIICKRIAELEKGNEELVDKKTDLEKRIFELEKENAELKVQIEQMKCCGNCQSVFDADGFCYLYKDGKCINQSEWIKRSNKK